MTNIITLIIYLKYTWVKTKYVQFPVVFKLRIKIKSNKITHYYLLDCAEV